MRHKKRRASRGFRQCLAASLPRQDRLRILWLLGGLKSVSDCYDFGLLGFRPRNRVLPQLPWDWLGKGGWRGGCRCCARRSPWPSPLLALSVAVSDRLRCERPEGLGLPCPLRRWASRPGRGTRAQLPGAGNLPALGREVGASGSGGPQALGTLLQWVTGCGLLLPVSRQSSLPSQISTPIILIMFPPRGN